MGPSDRSSRLCGRLADSGRSGATAIDGRLEQFFHGFDFLGLRGGEVGFLGEIGFEVVKLELAIGAGDELPVPPAQGEDARAAIVDDDVVRGFSGFWPLSTLRMLWLSSAAFGGSSSPRSSAIVAIMQAWVMGSSLTLPAGVWPGQRAMNGTR